MLGDGSLPDREVLSSGRAKHPYRLLAAIGGACLLGGLVLAGCKSTPQVATDSSGSPSSGVERNAASGTRAVAVNIINGTGKDLPIVPWTALEGSHAPTAGPAATVTVQPNKSEWVAEISHDAANVNTVKVGLPTCGSGSPSVFDAMWLLNSPLTYPEVSFMGEKHYFSEGEAKANLQFYGNVFDIKREADDSNGYTYHKVFTVTVKQCVGN